MNQLTVMLNGNPAVNQQANHHHQQQHPQQQQYFTFQTAGPMDHHQQQQQQQLVAFQQHPHHQSPTFMLANGCPPAGFHQPQHQQQQHQVQYIIAASPHHQPSPIISGPPQSQQTFGLVSNLITPAGINMIPVNQALPNTNALMQQQLVANGSSATLQPSAFIGHHQAAAGTFQIQAPNGSPGQATTAAQLFQPQPTQFQVIGTANTNPATLANGAIINSNQLIGGPNGQQFILNQTLTPATATNQQQQQQQQPQPSHQLYQLVLPNGQLIQTTLQPHQTNLVSTPLISSQSQHQQQPTAITVPIHNATNPINTIIAPNLTFSGQAAAFLAPSPSGTTAVPINSATILAPSQHHSPIQANVFSSPTSTTPVRENYLNLGQIGNSPNVLVANSQALSTTTTTTASSLSQPTTVLMNSNSIHPATTSNTSTTTTTAMMVLTQAAAAGGGSASPACSSSVPASLFEQKSARSIKRELSESCRNHSSGAKMPSQTGLVKAGTNTAAMATSITLTSAITTTPKLPDGINNKKIKVDCGQNTCTSGVDFSQQHCTDTAAKLVPPEPLRKSNEEKTATATMVVATQAATATSESEPSPPATAETLPRPPSAASSCGSLKIAEDDEEEATDDKDEPHNIRPDIDTELAENDNASTETEMEVDGVAAEIDNDPKLKELGFSTAAPDDDDDELHPTVEATNNDAGAKSNVGKDDKDGYQSSYGGSPCHFTDTEDEEEEEEENEPGENGEIKLIRRNGLTQAAYNLINNRILSSEEDNATTASIDSKCSSSASMLNEELCSINGWKTGRDKNSIDAGHGHGTNKVSIQIQTSATPSPVASTHSNDSLMEPESTTQNTLISCKEKSLWSPEEQELVNEIQEFAKAFKLCRLSLGLTQFQVGQELSALGPCYSQSAICRFEKLDITLKSAKKIKPVLENWMREAQEKSRDKDGSINIKPETLMNGILSKENAGSSVKISSALELVSKCNSAAALRNDIISSNMSFESSKKRKRRTSFTPATIDALNQFFEKNPHPNGSEMTDISRILKLDRDVVRVWFCNKRQATKAKNRSETPENPPPKPNNKSTSSNTNSTSGTNNSHRQSEPVAANSQSSACTPTTNSSTNVKSSTKTNPKPTPSSSTSSSSSSSSNTTTTNSNSTSVTTTSFSKSPNVPPASILGSCLSASATFPSPAPPPPSSLLNTLTPAQLFNAIPGQAVKTILSTSKCTPVAGSLAPKNVPPCTGKNATTSGGTARQTNR